MNIKKFLIGAAAGALMLSSMALPAFAKGPSAPAGNSNMAHLYLYEKDSPSWNIVEGGAWGKMTYNQEGSTFDYVFNGHGLQSSTEYSLIYYADPWPGSNPGALIANGTSNEGGNINLNGSTDLETSIPNSADANYPTGGKIWLVLSSDYNPATNAMIGWQPTKYLFENNLINFTYIP